jgi:hypothetical protein
VGVQYHDFTPEKETHYPLYRKVGGVKIISPLAGVQTSGWPVHSIKGYPKVSKC